MSAVSCIERFRQNFPIGWNDNRAALKPCLSSPDTEPPNDPIPETNSYELLKIRPGRQSVSEADACVVAHSLTLGWPKNVNVIRNLSCTIKRSRFTVVTGGMGCGKSTLLRSILGQAEISSGTLATSFTRAEYCSQSPWLLNQTIRQNILGTNSFESKWYSTVLKACELKHDVEDMSDGDLSVIGSEGVRLSGGQRKRLVWYLVWNSYYPRRGAYLDPPTGARKSCIFEARCLGSGRRSQRLGPPNYASNSDEPAIA
jgi:ABC-type multidrug transport system fused ATPase/permease subunit